MVHKWYKYTINKRIIKQSNNKLDKKKNRYNIVYYSGFMIDDISLLMISYFPMQSITMLENEKFMILWYKCGISVPFLTISNHKKITTKTKIKILFDMRVYFSHKVGKVV